MNYRDGIKVRFAGLGDSITLNTTTGVLPEEFWVGWLEWFLGGTTAGYNFGASGNTSLQALYRVPSLWKIPAGGTDAAPENEVLDVVGVMIGVNDPANGINQATTQAYVEDIVRAIRNQVDGVVAGQAELPNRWMDEELVPIGARYFVVADTSTSGGLLATKTTDGLTSNAAPALLDLPATLEGAQAGGRIWVKRQHKAGEAGWSRIADDPTRGPMVFVISTHYDASSTGDRVDTPMAANVNVRAAQIAAANAQGVSYCNLYDRTRARVVNGYLTDGLGELNYLPNNQHPSAGGGASFAVDILEWANETACPHVTGKTWLQVLKGE